MSLPTHLGRFEIEGVLGEGGSAVVYAALDGSRPVALKVLHPDQYADERQVDRFLEEAERLRRVEHASLIAVLGAGTLPGGRPFIVMPRLAGRALSSHLDVHGPLPLGEALHLFDGLAGAVGALHAAGLLHRDIKPDNVFLAEEDAEPASGATPARRTRRLVLLDLGIARDRVADPSTTTRAGFMRGTPAYMAPERLFGQPASPRSDLYELALTFFMMLTGHLPWEEGDPAGRIAPKLQPGDEALVPKPVADCLLRALSADVAQRFTSASDLVDALRAAAPHAPTTRSAVDPVLARSLPPRAAPTPTSGSATPSLPLVSIHPTPDRAVANPYAKTAKVLAPDRARSKLPWVGVFILGGGLTAGAMLALPKLAAPRAEALASATATAPEDPVEVSPAPPDPSAPIVTTAPSAESSGSAMPSASASVSASASASAPRVASAPGPIKEGVLPASQIESAVRARMSGMQSCLHGEAERPDFIGGRVVMNFWIGLDGSVTKASGTGENLPPAVTQCVLAQLRTIRFPQPVGGPVNVIFPIRFTPPKRNP